MTPFSLKGAAEMKTCYAFLVLTLYTFFLIPTPAHAAEPSRGIIVWQLEAKSGVSAKNIDSISGIIASEVEKNSSQKVLSETDIRTILKGEETRQRCTGDNDTSCVAEIGAAMGVPEAVSGDLGRLGNIWVLNLRRINVRKAEIIKRVTRQSEGTIEELVKSIHGAVAELFDVPLTQKENPKTNDKTLQVAGWSLFGSGLGLVVLGGVGHVMMKKERGKARSAFDAWKGVAISGYALGGAAALTGITLLIIDAVKPKKETEPKVAWGVSPTASGFTASLRLEW